MLTLTELLNTFQEMFLENTFLYICSMLINISVCLFSSSVPNTLGKVKYKMHFYWSKNETCPALSLIPAPCQRENNIS